MYNVLIVDDEPLTRNELVRIIKSRNEIGDIATAGDAVQALALLREKNIDVMFLDVKLPEHSGVELLEMLQEQHLRVPSVIFATAYSEHAVQAFDHHAVDYVLKPFSAPRIQRAISKAIHRTDTERVAKLVASLATSSGLVQAKPGRIAIKSQGRIVFLDPSEVMYAQAEGNYVLLQTGAGSHLMRECLTQIEQRLAPYGFLRIHRSSIVNSAFVSEVQPWHTGEYILKLINGKEFTVTRTYKRNLRQLLSKNGGGTVLGTDDAKL
ncbi:MAG TPA: LytTR family DNA-binding domain-containing protein [Candidatus Koribacter sp.]|jgi:two-component system LytT family response regulator